MNSKETKLAIIGGGIVGLATAMALTRRGIPVTVLEAEEEIASHQSGHNSGVIHSGLYYKPGSLKSENCVRGREALYEFCQEHGIVHERCGKIVVATSDEELGALDKLHERGLANGLKGLKKLKGEELKEYEPHLKGVAGLFVSQTGVVDFREVAKKYASIILENGGEIITSARAYRVIRKSQEIIVETTAGSFRTRALINCAGLQADRVAKMCGVDPGVRIVPFRGEFYELVPEKRHLVKGLIYPVPDLKFPFLGVHFTRGIDGKVKAGPNAVLAFKREGYKKFSFSLKDSLSNFTYMGFWKFTLKYVKMGLLEFYRSLNKRAFVRSLQKMIPEITEKDIVPGGAGVRAQALDRKGKLIDDFKIVQAPGMIHVLNAPSPAATASISIGETIASLAEKTFALQ